MRADNFKPADPSLLPGFFRSLESLPKFQAPDPVGVTESGEKYRSQGRRARMRRWVRRAVRDKLEETK